MVPEISVADVTIQIEMLYARHVVINLVQKGKDLSEEAREREAKVAKGSTGLD